MYYEEESLPELNIGESYSQKQLGIFIAENIDMTVISRSCSQFDAYSPTKLRVLEIIEGFEHKCDRQRTYHIPSRKTKIYIVD